MIGRRWTGVILRQLLLGTGRFAEIRDAIPAMTDRMLASRLRELEASAGSRASARPGGTGRSAPVRQVRG
ncbi:hypothetical protein GCM10023321_45790 [Pseudonocardia eucalypti]|uniref:HTH hxlR-type domain-containing protein n=1 Tax=Pseudonocardia eucalypti TaxID=648755 RepID=A0ABP9QGD0_9PSEU|nr:hypothetical protein [Pseudonocardia eucalypti]